MFQGPSRQYQKVSQNSDSDGDDVTLYAAVPLNVSTNEQTFGTGVYNRDLRLDLSSTGYLQTKTTVKLKEPRKLLYSILGCLAVLIVFVGLALTIVVYAQVFLPHIDVNLNSSNSTQADDSLNPSTTTVQCTLPPLPLPGNVNRCKTMNPPNINTVATMASPTTKTVTKEPAIIPTTSTSKMATEPQHPPNKPTQLPTHQTITTPTPNNPLSNEPPPETAATPQSVDWSRSFFPALTELSLQYLDVNQDGIQDVLTSKAKELCTSELIALDGLNGDTIWQTIINFEMFALRCVIDINRDGIVDCIASGRDGGFTALDGTDGSVLWVVDSRVSFPKANFYFPLIVDDLDSDGVPDLINTHGGGIDYPDSVKDRLPGFLVVISGRTGGKLIDPILTPDGHETYCSPVLFKFGTTDMVLFGSGGETMSGSLWAITMDSIKINVIRNRLRSQNTESEYKIETDDSFHPCFMNKDFIETLTPVFNSSVFDEGFTKKNSFLEKCPLINQREIIWNSYDLCLYEIFDSPDKGVMLPPVIIDLNADEVDDLILSTFTGHLYALDGHDLSTVLWERFFPGTESYSIPTPFFYTEDFFPDLLIRTNVGVWSEHYTASNLYILDGQNGNTLWSQNTDHMVMNSGISIASDSHGKDAILLFSTLKRSGHQRQQRNDNMQGPPEQRGPPPGFVPNLVDIWVSTPDDQFPDPDNDLSGFLDYCSDKTDVLSVSVYLLTREMIESGVEIKPLVTELPILHKGVELPPNTSVIVKRQGTSFNPSSPPGSNDYYGEAPEDINNIYMDSNNRGNPGLPPDSDQNQMDPNAFPPNFNEVDLNDKKALRCAHLMSPVHNVATPIIGDVNGDGRLEVTYVIGRATASKDIPYLDNLLNKLDIKTFTIEDKFKEVYGERVLDFGRFLSADKQPWGSYMGQTGDNVYHPQHKLRDN